MKPKVPANILPKFLTVKTKQIQHTSNKLKQIIKLVDRSRILEFGNHLFIKQQLFSWLLWAINASTPFSSSPLGHWFVVGFQKYRQSTLFKAQCLQRIFSLSVLIIVNVFLKIVNHSFPFLSTSHTHTHTALCRLHIHFIL